MPQVFLWTLVFSVSFFLLLVTKHSFQIRKVAREKRPSKRTRVADDAGWNDLASGIFLQHGGAETDQSRIEKALRIGMLRLEMQNAIVLLHSESETTVLASIIGTYEKAFELQKGNRVDSSKLFCGLLGRHRPQLAVDFASMTDWRNHNGFKIMGWESYLGVGRALGERGYLTLSFFQHQSREQLFTKQEKEFASQLTNWIGAILGNSDTISRQESLRGSSKLSEARDTFL